MKYPTCCTASLGALELGDTEIRNLTALASFRTQLDRHHFQLHPIPFFIFPERVPAYIYLSTERGNSGRLPLDACLLNRIYYQKLINIICTHIDIYIYIYTKIDNDHDRVEDGYSFISLSRTGNVSPLSWQKFGSRLAWISMDRVPVSQPPTSSSQDFLQIRKKKKL